MTGEPGVSTEVREMSAWDYVAGTGDCLPEQVGEVGGKAVGLGSLLRAGQRVPGLRSWSPRTAATSRVASAPEPRGLPHRCADVDRRTPTPRCCEPRGSRPGRRGPLQRHGGGLGRGELGRPVPDLPRRVRAPSEVLDQVEQCWVAALDPHVGAYRRRPAARGGRRGVAVIVQELVDARAAGVMFTQHPETGDRSLIVIESSYGLGEAVVGGEVVPDLFEMNKITRQRHRARSRAASRRAPAALRGPRRVSAVPVEPVRQQDWSTHETEVMALADMAADLESKLGRGLDMEWAIGTIRTGGPSADAATPSRCRLFALQVRPITVAVGPRGPGAAGPRRPRRLRAPWDAIGTSSGTWRRPGRGTPRRRGATVSPRLGGGLRRPAVLGAVGVGVARRGRHRRAVGQ